MLFQVACGTESNVAVDDVKQAVCRMGGVRSLRNRVVDNLNDEKLFDFKYFLGVVYMKPAWRVNNLLGSNFGSLHVKFLC